MTRRGIVFAAAIAVLLAGACRGDGNGDGPAPVVWKNYADPALGWSAQYPQGWAVHPYAVRVGGKRLRGAFFSNEQIDPGDPQLSPGTQKQAWDLGFVSGKGAVVEVQHLEGAQPPDGAVTVPIDYEEIPGVHQPSGSARRWQAVNTGGDLYVVRIWYSPDVSIRDKELSQTIVESLKFS